MIQSIKIVFAFVAISTVLVPLNSAIADINYSTVNSVVNEKFDSLATTGFGNTWTNDTTIGGWYASRNWYVGDSGNTLKGGLHSYGVSGVNPVSDRAFGSFNYGPIGTLRYGVALVNNTGVTLHKIDLGYTGEQWRRENNVSTQNMTVAYTINPNNQYHNSSTTFTAVSALTFTSPVVGAGSGTALDGNLATNRVTLSTQLLNVNWQPGQVLFIRWTDINHPGLDHGLAIDDFHIQANIPEPTGVAAIAGLLVLVSAGYRRRAC